MSAVSISRRRVPWPEFARLVAAVALAVLAFLGLQTFRAMGPAPDSSPLPVDQSGFAAETGVWIEHVALIAADGVIEIRYRTLDSARSEIVHDVDNPPRVVTADGFELATQRHEHPHDRINTVGTTYNEQVMNIGGVLSRGDVVTVYVGTTALEGVVVQ